MPGLSSLSRVVIDKEVLGGFKGRALKTYPVEHGECLWGHIEGETAYIVAIERADVEADTESVEIDGIGYDFGESTNGETLLGTIHSHPDDYCRPSESDIETANEEPVEQIMGICAINKVNKRRYVSFGFFLPTGEPVELAIAEKDKHGSSVSQ